MRISDWSSDVCSSDLMWEHTATRRNVERLREDGVMIMQPDEGPMACGEFGEGRLPDPEAILQEISKYFSHRRDKQGPASPKNLAGKHILITAGPTHEPIDPVRYIANSSSGRQGYAIAARTEEQKSELQSLMRISNA